MKCFLTLLKNEGKLSIRDMNMVIFALIMPLAVLIVLGILYGRHPAFEGAPYSFMAQSFGALCAISICAGGLMGLPLVVADYRERRILKRFRVTPARAMSATLTAFTAPMTLRFTQGTSTRPATGSQTSPIRFFSAIATA